MGRPRKAWLSIRRAWNLGLLLGLHVFENRLEPEVARIWSTVCDYDCLLSLTIGVPHSAHSPEIRDVSGSTPIEGKLMHGIGRLCSQINDRNHDHRGPSYAVTSEIDEQLDGLDAMVPVEWRNMTTIDQLPLDVFHARHTLKLYLLQVRMLTHLPYMTKAQTDKKYDYSRTSVLEAAEGMIQCYGERLLHPDGANIMCFLLDFAVFSAGLILVTDLIAHQSLWRPEDQEQKWSLISTLILELKHAASLMDHPVADQAATLLDYLYSACHGVYSGPDVYEAEVPYFGKVLIRRPHSQAQGILEGSHPSTSVCDGTNDWWSSVTLNTNIFGFDDATSTELDVDWTSMLDDRVTYNWTGTFEF